MILQLSIGGCSGAGRERGGMRFLKSDIASLSTRICNFQTRVYENSPELIGSLVAEMKARAIEPEVEAFAFLWYLRQLKGKKITQIVGPLHVQFVMGVKNAMLGDRETFEFFVEPLKRISADATGQAPT